MAQVTVWTERCELTNYHGKVVAMGVDLPMIMH
jgi:hypothetical protein